jgi:predicted TIM-barrel fold metal-dependent hydrolase
MIIDSHQHMMLPTELQLYKMNEAGIDKAILFTTSPHPERAHNLEELKQEMNALFQILHGAHSKEDSIKRSAGNILELAAVIDKFYGFGSVPLGLSSSETADWIDHYIIKNRLKGIGEFTPGNDEQMEQLQSVFEALTQFTNLPMWVHTFHPVSNNGIKILMNLCSKYPKVPVIWGHMGGSYWMEVINFAKSTPNAYLDLSASFSSLATKMAIAELPERCLFSSDAPYGEPLLCRQQIEYVCDSDSIARMVLGDNFLELVNYM